MEVTRKYIIIPEYKPLYAMAKCFGPTHGPLNKPTPVPVDIIKLLLMQDRAPVIFEVVPQANGVYSDPVQLYIDNYNLPYDALVGKEPETVDPVLPVAGETVEPVADVVEPVVEESVVVEETSSDEVAPVTEDAVDETPEVDVTEVEEPAAPVAEETVTAEEVAKVEEPAAKPATTKNGRKR